MGPHRLRHLPSRCARVCVQGKNGAKSMLEKLNLETITCPLAPPPALPRPAPTLASPALTLALRARFPAPTLTPACPRRHTRPALALCRPTHLHPPPTRCREAVTEIAKILYAQHDPAKDKPMEVEISCAAARARALVRTSSPSPAQPHRLPPQPSLSTLPWLCTAQSLGERARAARAPHFLPPAPTLAALAPTGSAFLPNLVMYPNLGRPGSPGWALAVRQVDLRRDGQDAHDRAGRHQGSAARSKCLLGSARARRLRLLRGRLAALGGSALPGSGRPTGRPATASGARASHLQSRPFSTPLTIQEEAETAAKAYREAMDDD